MRLGTFLVKNIDFEAGLLGLNSGSVMSLLCELAQVICPLCASAFQPVEGVQIVPT